MKIASIKESLASALTALGYFGMFILTIFGIARAFHKGIGHGVASILMPPYAWYRGVATIWEPPQWKEEWDENTRIMAVTLLASVNQTTENQVYISQKVDDLHKWATKLPKGKRLELKSDADRYCRQYVRSKVCLWPGA